ncbi:MAG: hypothetical protein ACREBT_05795 [Thermoplasmata archaeon]
MAALGLGKRPYTPELRVAAAELATRTSYGEASEAIERDLGARIPLTEVEALAQRLDRAMCPRSARAIRRGATALVVFAEVAAYGIRLPATSNGIEGVMGMIAERYERKWARWERVTCSLLVCTHAGGVGGGGLGRGS